MFFALHLVDVDILHSVGIQPVYIVETALNSNYATFETKNECEWIFFGIASEASPFYRVQST